MEEVGHFPGQIVVFAYRLNSAAPERDSSRRICVYLCYRGHELGDFYR